MRTDGHAERWTDGQPDMTKLIVAFRNFAKASTNFSSASEILYPDISV
jgi:hypothetical protein